MKLRLPSLLRNAVMALFAAGTFGTTTAQAQDYTMYIRNGDFFYLISLPEGVDGGISYSDGVLTTSVSDELLNLRLYAGADCEHGSSSNCMHGYYVYCDASMFIDTPEEALTGLGVLYVGLTSALSHPYYADYLKTDCEVTLGTTTVIDDTVKVNSALKPCTIISGENGRITGTGSLTGSRTTNKVDMSDTGNPDYRYQFGILYNAQDKFTVDSGITLDGMYYISGTQLTPRVTNQVGTFLCTVKNTVFRWDNGTVDVTKAKLKEGNQFWLTGGALLKVNNYHLNKDATITTVGSNAIQGNLTIDGGTLGVLDKNGSNLYVAGNVTVSNGEIVVGANLDRRLTLYADYRLLTSSAPITVQDGAVKKFKFYYGYAGDELDGGAIVITPTSDRIKTLYRVAEMKEPNLVAGMDNEGDNVLDLIAKDSDTIYWSCYSSGEWKNGTHYSTQYWLWRDDVGDLYYITYENGKFNNARFGFNSDYASDSYTTVEIIGDIRILKEISVDYGMEVTWTGSGRIIGDAVVKVDYFISENAGDSELIIRNANTYTGGTEVWGAGLVTLQNVKGLGTGTIRLYENGRINLNDLAVTNDLYVGESIMMPTAARGAGFKAYKGQIAVQGENTKLTVSGTLNMEKDILLACPDGGITAGKFSGKGGVRKMSGNFDCILQSSGGFVYEGDTAVNGGSLIFTGSRAEMKGDILLSSGSGVAFMNGASLSSAGHGLSAAKDSMVYFGSGSNLSSGAFMTFNNSEVLIASGCTLTVNQSATVTFASGNTCFSTGDVNLYGGTFAFSGDGVFSFDSSRLDEYSWPAALHVVADSTLSAGGDWHSLSGWTTDASGTPYRTLGYLYEALSGAELERLHADGSASEHHECGADPCRIAETSFKIEQVANKDGGYELRVVETGHSVCATLIWNAAKSKWGDRLAGDTWLCEDSSITDLYFHNTYDSVVFRGGEAEIVGSVLPRSVRVEGYVRWTGGGSIDGGTSVLMAATRGTLTIENANNYTGGTIIQSGTVQTLNARALGVGTVTFSPSTSGERPTLDMSHYALANDISVEATAEIIGGDQYAGVLTLKNGAFLSQNNKGEKLRIADHFELQDGRVFNRLTGDGYVQKTGTGTVYLICDNSYTGHTEVAGGKLQLASEGAISSRREDLAVGRYARVVDGAVVSADSAAVVVRSGASLMSSSLVGAIKAASVYVESGATMGSELEAKLNISDGALFAASGADLRGSIVLSGVSVASGSALLTVTGNLTMGQSEVIQYTGTPAAGSRGADLLIHVTGNAVVEHTCFRLHEDVLGADSMSDFALGKESIKLMEAGTLTAMIGSLSLMIGDTAYTGSGSSEYLFYKAGGALYVKHRADIVLPGPDHHDVPIWGDVLVWDAGKGTWGIGSAGDFWKLTGFYEDGSVAYGHTLFANGSAVLFAQGGDVTLAGDVAPSRISVCGEKDLTIRGASIVGGTGLSKTGSATMTLDGVHSYTGVTSVQEGVLVVGGSLEGTRVLVGPAATLKVLGGVKKDISIDGGRLVTSAAGMSLCGNQTLSLKGAAVSGKISTAEAAVLETVGAVTITGGLSLDGGTWSWVSGDDALVSISGTLDIASGTTLKLDAMPGNGGSFTIAHYDALEGDLGLVSIEGPAELGRVKYSLSDTGNDLLLVADGEGVELLWQGAKGVWMHGGDISWSIPEGSPVDNRFFNGDDVVFATKATVTIVGDVAPGSVQVKLQGKDSLTFSGRGTIVGTCKLTMAGSGTLKMNAANSYTGGTVVNGGVVTATGDKSFGSGLITLNNGTLNLGGKVVANDIEAHGGLLTGAAKYAGVLAVEDSLELKGNLIAKSVVVDGTLKAGTIKDSAIVLNDGSISSAISGKSSVTVTGEGSLMGKLSYTGGTTIDGGTIASSFTVAAKQTLAATTGSIGGDLTLGGGSILLADNMALTVSGAVRLTKASTLDVSSLKGSATIAFDSLTGDTAKFLKLSAPTDGRKSYAMEIGDKAITVTASGDNTSLTWQGAKGKWEVAGTQVWTGGTDDNRFYHGDSVTFSSAATVTLATKLAPGSVTVQGDGAVTFSGSGSIAGDAALTMSGSNTLKMNATNTYTGGTVITSGTVLATGVDSFGKGDIELSGGTLNLGKKAVKNNIMVTNSATILNAKGFAGVITVQGGTLSLTDSLTGTLVLHGGTLDLSGVKNVAKMTFGNVVCGAEATEIVDAKGQHYAFVGNKLVQVEREAAESARTVAAEPDRAVVAVPVPQHVELPGAGLYTTMMRAQLDGNRAAFDSIRQLMGTGEPSTADGRYRFAAQATSVSTDMKDYRRQGFGGLVMVEEVFSDKAVGGLSLNYEHADINPDGAGKYESDDTRVNAHLLVSTKNWQSRSIAGIGIHDYDVNRSSATGHSFNLMEEISRTIAVDDKSVIAPFVRVETGYNVIGSINDGVLSIDKQTAWSTDITLGARYVKEFDSCTLMLEAGATKAIGDQGGAISASLVDDLATRAALSPTSRNRWSAVLGGSVQIPVGTRSSLHAGATLRFHGGTTEVNANVGYSIKF